MRRSTDGGDTWQNIHTLPADGYVLDMTVDVSGNLYLVGRLQGWFVLRRDSGGVWHDIEKPFDTSNPSDSQAWAVTTDRVGNVFVVGFQRKIGSTDHVTAVVQQSLSRIHAVRSNARAHPDPLPQEREPPMAALEKLTNR